MIEFILPLAFLSIVSVIVSAGKCATSTNPDDRALWKIVFDASVVVGCVTGFALVIFG